MAIRKDLDDMLNSLKPADKKAGKAGQSAPAHPRKTKFDDMSVDDLLGVLSGSQSGGASDIAEKIEEELAEPATVPEPAPAPEPAIEAVPQPEPVKEESAEPRKKRIVITGELPDYEAIRQRELEKDKAEKLRLEEEARQEAARQAEEAARQEAARQAEEAARQEAARQAEEAARQEAARQAEEAAKQEAARREAEAARLREEAERQAEEAAREAENAAAAALAQDAVSQETLPEDSYTAEEIQEPAAEEASGEKPKKGLFSKLKDKFSGEKEEPAGEEAPAEEPAEKGSDEVVFTEELIVNQTSIDDVFGEEAYAEETAKASEPSVDELMAAAIAAVNEEIAAEEATETAEEEAPEEPAEEPEERPADPVGSMIENMRSDAASAIADIEAPREEPVQEEKPARPVQAEPAAEEIPAAPEKPAKKKGKVTSALQNILDEDPQAIMDERTVKTEDGDDEPKSTGKLKKTIYAVLGVIFAALACIGLATVITKGMDYWGSFTSGETKRDGFVNVIYPAVIMDIESFQSPSELTSEQIITAALWSMIMDGTSLEKYQMTFDVVSVPSTDVEAAAVKLFGENIPQLTHTTVGPANSRFYYNEESKTYNVPVKPATYTYSPDIKSVSKNGSEYTVTVDYIDELPAWMERTSSKSVEFKLTETNEGYQISAMKVLSENNSL